MMDRKMLALVLLLVPVLAAGCASIKGGTVAEKRQYVLDMKSDVLKQLYAKRPAARNEITKAAGYGVFSNRSIKFLVAGAGSAYGVVTNNKTGKHTYMRMVAGSAGLGLGIKDYRTVFVFLNRASLQRFIDRGWEFSGEAEAAVKTHDDGVSLSVAKSADLGVTVYQMSEASIALQATLQGAKYRKIDELNQ
jgi:lipid-binding SYLF domain-containing protein